MLNLVGMGIFARVAEAKGFSAAARRLGISKSVVSKEVSKLEKSLETSHWGKFVAIEPDSETFYLGRTLDEAVQIARQAHPEAMTYTCRIGHPVALEIG